MVTARKKQATIGTHTRKSPYGKTVVVHGHRRGKRQTAAAVARKK